MATSKSTTTRKSSTTRAASSARSKSDTEPDATTEATTDATTTDATTPEASGGSETGDAQETAAATAGGNETPTSADDPAAELKRKIRTTQHVTDVRPDELTDEQRLNLVGAPASALPGPRTLPSPSSPTRAGEEYVHAETEGHIAFVPKRQKQSSTVRVWIAGQHVRKDTYEALSGFVAATPSEARVLSDEEYAQVAPHL